MRFLIIRLSSIGDIVHALPAVSALARTFPDADVDWVVEARYAVLLEGNPWVKRVVKLDTLGWRSNLSSSAVIEKVARGIALLRETTYDAVLDFQGLIKSAIISKVSRSQRRLGFAENWLREPAAGMFYDESVAPRDRRHIIEMNFALAEHLGARNPGPAEWEFPLPGNQSDDSYIEKQLSEIDAKDFLVINPGGGWQAKRWAPRRYAEIIRRLDAECSGKIILTGSPEEEALVREILNLANSTRAHYIPSTLVQLIALVRRARLFLSGDTGPMHLAAAVRAPIVAIFGSTDPLNTPERNGPFSPADIMLSNGHPLSFSREIKTPHYIEGVSTEAVFMAVRERLARAHA
ncbi:MAG TPA: lipopolysaccharide heptosyltransferase I [Terriglobia bacterium]|nr:lipopolysaccharide heptosyltransferase I [Terriglobia bacterium]